jgi:hypothetical protein
MRGERERDANKMLSGISEGRDRLEDLSVDGRVILKWIINK